MTSRSVFLFFVVLGVAYVNCKPQGFGFREKTEDFESGSFGTQTEPSTTRYGGFGISEVENYNSGYTEGQYENHHSSSLKPTYNGPQSSSVKPATYEPVGHYNSQQSSSVKPTAYEPQGHYNGQLSSSVKPATYEPAGHNNGHLSSSIKPATHKPEGRRSSSFKPPISVPGAGTEKPQSFFGAVGETIIGVIKEATHQVQKLFG